MIYFALYECNGRVKVGNQADFERHIDELKILNQIANALNREVDLEQALNTALEHIVTLFDLQTGWIFLHDQSGKKFYTAGAIGLPPALANHPRRLGGTCYCLDEYKDGNLNAENIDAIICSRLKSLKEGTAGLQYHASIPLVGQTTDTTFDVSKELGVLNVASTDWREIEQSDLELLHTVGDMLSIAIQRTYLFQRSREIGAIQERNRLARDIHDTLAQGLAAIALQLDTLDSRLDSDISHDEIHNTVEHIMKIARLNLEEARRSVLDLRATPLDNHTLAEAIHKLVKSINHPIGELITEGNAPPLSSRLSTSIYRIIQEAIQNIKQHADASQYSVTLSFAPKRLQVIIEDDGCGFNAYKPVENRFGIRGMTERIKLLSGQIDIVSAKNEGTIIDMSIPLTELIESKHDD